MYTITFYSFKGGVGRSLSLANCALELVRRGKNVLVVDFDLEAPGLSTYKEFESAANALGIVDYVCDYIASKGIGPDVLDYIHECSSEDYGAGRLWLMPAGQPGIDYGRRLHSIDWKNLYDEMDGYLMIEDMKGQWDEKLSPDYVLIDSRTGHTDIGGICTRQLPDAVVALFFPNNQNISGLKIVTDEIRYSDPSNLTRLLFVPSRIPDIDDENDILQNHLDDAKRLLEYEKTCTPIFQYNSLDLIDEDLFVTCRAKTRLAKEYKELTSDCVVGNFEDRDSALLLLERQRAHLSNRSSRDTPSNISEIDPGRRGPNEIELYLEKIAGIHFDDGEIFEKIAYIYIQLSNIFQAASYFTAAIEHGNDSPRVVCARGHALSYISEKDLAIKDFESVLLNPDSVSREKIDSIRSLLWLGQDALDELPIEKIVDELTITDVLQLSAFDLHLSVERLIFADRLYTELERQLTGENLESVVSNHGFVMIGLGKFETALEYIIQGDTDEGEIQDVFNYAMALWGETGKFPVQKMQRVIELHDESKPKGRIDPNYTMCLALAYAVVGNKSESTKLIAEASKRVKATPGKHLSSWQYLTVSRETFLKDLTELGKFVEDPDNNLPRVFKPA